MLFTVVIAEKEHIQSIQEYAVFLKPFLDDSHIEFCEWRPEEGTLADSVPSLTERVAHHQDWRAVVLCDGRGLRKKNPFDLVEFKAPEFQPLDSEDEEAILAHRRQYLEQLRHLKFQAFDQAAQQPLTRLMTYLCASPLVTRGKNNAASEDPDFAEYLAESARKQELRRQIIGEEKLGIPLPAEVLCVARRTYTEQEYDISTAWVPHEDFQYSRFYDWNLYFDKMRYLVFDILPQDDKNYEFDYIRFLYAVLILANHDTPPGVLRPNRVFCLNCENDEQALVHLVSLYDAKLAKTSESLAAKVDEIRNTEKARLSDHDAKMIFCSNINVPVSTYQEIDHSGLYADPNALGLSTDCPRDELGAWEDTYLTSRRTLQKLLKQPRRTLKGVVADMRRMNHVDLSKAGLLNEFQAEDVRDYTGEEELNMVSVVTPDLYDTKRYEEQMEQQSQAVRQKIGTRMTKRTTIALGATALVLYLAGFLPLLFNNLSDRENILWSLAVTGAAIALLAVVALVCLFFLRGGLRELYRAFNRVMYSINGEIDGSLALYSRYLSHAGNVMRGFRVLDFLARNIDPDAVRIQVLNKHMADITRIREELREVFGPYVSPRAEEELEKVDTYLYDFSRAVDFPYPVPYSEGMKCQIEFMQPGVTVQVPVNFVKRITLRREELYD